MPFAKHLMRDCHVLKTHFVKVPFSSFCNNVMFHLALIFNKFFVAISSPWIVYKACVVLIFYFKFTRWIFLTTEQLGKAKVQFSYVFQTIADLSAWHIIFLSVTGQVFKYDENFESFTILFKNFLWTRCESTSRCLTNSHFIIPNHYHPIILCGSL